MDTRKCNEQSTQPLAQQVSGACLLNHDNKKQQLVLRISETGPEAVRIAFAEAGWSQYNPDTDNDKWNLWWRTSRFKKSEYANANSFQRMNHFINSGAVTRKDQLLRNMRGMQAVFGKMFDFIPVTFILPNEYTKFVMEYSKDDESDSGKKCAWICKPADLSRGRKIFLITDLHQLRYDQKCVIQKYIQHPLTIGGYKLDLRVYVLVTSFHPLRIHIFRNGVARFGTEKYDPNMEDITNLYAHLTNSSINKNSSTFKQIKEVIGSGAKWTFRELEDWFLKNNLNYKLAWERMKHVVNLTLLSIANKIPKNDACFELFGFDILLDKLLNPWLIEVNCAPALGISCQVDEQVKRPLLREAIKTLNVQQFNEKHLESARKQLLSKRKAKKIHKKQPFISTNSRSGKIFRRLKGKVRVQPVANDLHSENDGTKAVQIRKLSATEPQDTSESRTEQVTTTLSTNGASVDQTKVLSESSLRPNNNSPRREPPIRISTDEFEETFPCSTQMKLLSVRLSELALDTGTQKEYMDCLREVMRALREIRRRRCQEIVHEHQNTFHGSCVNHDSIAHRKISERSPSETQVVAKTTQPVE